jgi:ParB family transcriptional regulator, chromosome partitioning protein
MNQKPHARRGLGRGLGALIPTAPRPDVEAEPGATRTVAPAGSADWIGVPLPGDDVAPRSGEGRVPRQTETDGVATPERASGSPETTERAPGQPDENGVGDDDQDAVTEPDAGGDAAANDAAANDAAANDAAANDAASKDAAASTDPGSAATQDDVSLGDVSPGDVSPGGVSQGDATGIGTTGSAATGTEDTAGDELRPVDGAYFAELLIGSISPNPRQPREVFDEEAMAELVHSVREVGLLQPVVVRPTGGDRYELIMGERRWRATQQAGLERIPAIVRETADDDLLRDALLENLHRAELNALEEAAAYQQLLQDFGCTHDELAARIGRSRPQISNTIRLLRLSPAVQRRVAAGVLSAGHARALLAVDDAATQDRLAGRVVAEGISVRGLEEIVSVGELGSERPGPVRRSRPTAPGVEDLAARLSDRLETRVRVDLGKRKGRITVEFASLPDLERIVAVIDPEHPTRTHRDSDHA